MTGGTGTLGQNLVSAALARGHEVRVLSRRAGAAVAEGASLAVADVLTGQGLDGGLDRAEVVIHAATSPLRRARATEVEGTRVAATASPTTERNWRLSWMHPRPCTVHEHELRSCF